MKLWRLTTFYTASLLLLSSCASGPTPPSPTQIDTTLPIVELTKNGVITDMRTVAFEWNTLKDPRVNGVVVYREHYTPEDGSTFELHDVVSNRFQTHYLDQRVEPETNYKYKFATFSERANGVMSRVASVATLPALASVSWIHSITGLPRTAKIIWRPHSSQLVKRYIVERKTLDDEEWSIVARLDGRLNAEFIDQDLEDNSVYLYRVKVETYNSIISKPSDIVKVVTKALPQEVMNIKATNNLPKKIRVEWDPVMAEDFRLYHVYRSSSPDGGYDLVAKLRDTTFTDSVVEDGASYYYRVSAVDKDGLESPSERHSIHGQTLVKPNAPALVEGFLRGSIIELTWRKTDARTLSYTVERTESAGWLDSTTTTFKGVESEHFIDRKIRPNAQYSYTVYSVDRNNILSERSQEVKLVTPEHMGTTRPQKIKAPQQNYEAPVVPQRRVVPQTDGIEEVIMPMEDMDMSEI